MVKDVTTITNISGQIRRRRKLCKFLFFIEIQPTDQTPTSQIFFRTDDTSLTLFEFQESYRRCKPGNVVQVQVGDPLDPNEQVGKDFKVWQCNKPVQVITTCNAPFTPDVPLESKQKQATLEKEPLNTNLVCKYWINKNPCERGEQCLFQHPTGEEFEKARIQWLEEREKNRKMATYNPEDPHTSKKPHGLRAIIFAEWIRRTFKKELDTGLENQSRVLDIAGGKGEISYVLGRGFGIPCTVIEPVKRKLPNYWFTRLRRLMYRFETGSMEQPDWKSKEIQIDLMSWPFNVTPNYIHTLLNDQFIIDYEELISNVSLLIGLHSDQATIPIVDTALKLGKAFAVVPCCVFSHDNQTRRLKSGELVTTTEQQIQYICEKDTKGKGEIKTAYLDFEGKNRVVYWIPY